MSEWISVDDELPKPKKVIVYAPNGHYGKVYSAYYDRVFHTGDDIITHWMPLPEPPIEDKDK